MDKEIELKLITNLANQLSLSRVKTEGFLFDRDYSRDDTGAMRLVSEKAVIRTQGKTTKAAFGEGQEYATYEDAVTAVKAHWAAYFKARRRLDKTAATVISDKKRQKRYYENKKARNTEINRQQ